jgi:hypothetical protein
VRRPLSRRDQHLNRAAGQLTAGVAEHVRQPPAGQDDRAVGAGEQHPVRESLHQLAQRQLARDRSPGPGRQRLLAIPGRRTISAGPCATAVTARHGGGDLLLDGAHRLSHLDGS